MRKNRNKFPVLILLMTLVLAGCENTATTSASDTSDMIVSESSEATKDAEKEDSKEAEKIASRSFGKAENSDKAEESTADNADQTQETAEQEKDKADNTETAEDTGKAESGESTDSSEQSEASEPTEPEAVEEIIVKEVSYEKYCNRALNVRDYPDKSGNRLHTFALNDKVSVIGECDNGWVQIKFNDGVAYVSGRYLSDEETVIKQEVTVTVQTTTTAEGDQNLEMAQQVFALVNQIRVENGVAELTWDDRLYESSKIRAEEASVNWSHTRPDGSSCFTVSDVMHGENLAKGYSTPEAVVDGWMNSQGHKDNILNASFTRTAIAYYNTDQGALWCHHFGY